MQSFLQDVVNHLALSPEELSGYTFVLPNKRAGAYLKHLLGEKSQTPFFGPRVVSIEDFAQEIADLRPVSNTELLFHSYNAYRSLPLNQHDDLETFSGWITPLLSDFNEIDRYCLPSEEVFLSLSRIKALERWEIDSPSSELMESHLQFWEQLPQLYQQLQEELQSIGMGYQGMIFRKASEDIEHYINAASNSSSSHLFVGFNALNTAEQLIIQELLRRDMAKVYWDMDGYFLERSDNGASSFISRFINDWPYYRVHQAEFVGENYTGKKDIELIEVQKQVGQVHYTAELLAGLDDDELAQTAVVLADEKLLTPLLYALPENVKKVNITMGTPLKTVPATSFFDQLLLLKSKGGKTMHHSAVTSLLQHPLSRVLMQSPADIVSRLNTQNLSYPSLEDLLHLAEESDRDLLHQIFAPWKTVSDAISGCQDLIELWRQLPNPDPVLTASLYKIHKIFSEIGRLHQQFGHLNNLRALHGLYQDLVRMEQLDLEGHPLTGLQIMGLLETRALDFDRVIVLSVNEGTLPTGKQASTYLPFDVKRAFELPTFDEKDAIFAYHFFRLLFRPTQIHLLFNSYSEGVTTGEPSRFIRMLRLQSLEGHHIRETRIAPKLDLSPKELMVITKNEEILEQLTQLGDKGFSPSALTTYIRNPIDFYKRYILGIRDAEEMEETVAYNTLGTIVHDSLEELYQPHIGSALKIEALNKMLKDVGKVISTQFTKHFKRGEIDKGMNKIIYEVARRYVEKMIALDREQLKAGAKIELISLEEELAKELPLQILGEPLRIRGKADRIDRFNGCLRIIDYKTGKVEQSNLKVTDWDELIRNEKLSKAFQVLTYALLLHHSYPGEEIQAGIISFKNFRAGFLPFTQSSKQITIDQETLQLFESQLVVLIKEICSVHSPFIEKEIPSYDY